MLKPELKIKFFGGQVESSAAEIVADFKPMDNVKAIKGLVMKSLSPEARKNLPMQNIIVKLKEQHLKDSQKLIELDFADDYFIVQCLQ